MQIINTEAIVGQQDLRLTAYAKGARPLQEEARWRVILKRDFYDFQCRFYVERWDGEKWREAYTALDHSGLRIMGHSTSEPVYRWRADAEADALDLLNKAVRLVG